MNIQTREVNENGFHIQVYNQPWANILILMPWIGCFHLSEEYAEVSGTGQPASDDQVAQFLLTA